MDGERGGHAAAVLVALRDACAGFEADGELGRSIKSRVVQGSIGGTPAAAKCLTTDDPVWRWYLAREAELYRRFERAPPPVRAPRVLAHDPARGVLVLERLPGRPLAATRRPARPSDERALGALLDALARIARWDRGVDASPREPPPPPDRARMRERLLEDPTAPLAWVLEGVGRCAALGLLDAGAAGRVDAALRAWPATAFAHGDALLRNAIADGGTVALVDWECAGAHPAGWDLALLRATVHPSQRARVASAALARFGDGAAFRAYLACVAFALARERAFLRRSGARASTSRAALERALCDDLRDTLHALGAPRSSRPR